MSHPGPHPILPPSFLRLDYTSLFSANGLRLRKEGEEKTEIPQAMKPPDVPQAALGISELKSSDTDLTWLVLWSILVSWDRESKFGGGVNNKSQWRGPSLFFLSATRSTGAASAKAFVPSHPGSPRASGGHVPPAPSAPLDFEDSAPHQQSRWGHLPSMWRRHKCSWSQAWHSPRW